MLPVTRLIAIDMHCHCLVTDHAFTAMSVVAVILVTNVEPQIRIKSKPSPSKGIHMQAATEVKVMCK